MGKCVWCSKQAITKRHCQFHRDYINLCNRKSKKKHSDTVKPYNSQWKKDHPEKLAEQWKRAYERRKDVLGYARSKAWRLANPEKRLEQARRSGAVRKARKRAGGKFTTLEWRVIKAIQQQCCFDCGRSDVRLSVGHLIPVCKGGSNDLENIVAQCMRCNNIQGRNNHPSIQGG